MPPISVIIRRRLRFKMKLFQAPILRISMEVSNSWPAAIRSTTTLMPEWRVGSVSKALPYLIKKGHTLVIAHTRAHTQRQSVCTSSRPDLCWSDHWNQSSWTCPCRSVHTGSRCLTPPCPWTPQAAGSTAKPWDDLQGDSSWHGKSFFVNMGSHKAPKCRG